MTIARCYRMEAVRGQADALAAALGALTAALARVPGCEGTDLLRDLDAPDQFLFIEKWASVRAHKDGGAILAKDALAPVMAALAGRPDAAYLEYLPS